MPLRKQFHSNTIEKVYVAIVEGHLDTAVLVENYIGTPHRRAKKVRVYEDEPAARERARPARSLFRGISYSSESDCTRVEVEMYTGCRHQIRAHAAFLGHPLVGDELYRSTRSFKSDRQYYLHACKITFTHPNSGRRISVMSPEE